MSSVILIYEIYIVNHLNINKFVIFFLFIYFFFFKYFLTMNISWKIGIVLDAFFFFFSSDNEKTYAEISKVMKVNVSTVSNFITTVVLCTNVRSHYN